jgi:ADP-ribose pyrophosphatase YjhB (NUDIX family)
MSVVAAVIADDAGRVLLCRQRQGHQLWGLPGGRIRAAESPIHAVIRDIREESGLETEMVDIVGLYTLTGDGAGAGVPDVVVYVFRGRPTAGEAAVNAPGMVAKLAWYDVAALPHPLTATTRRALADAAAGRSGLLGTVERDPEPEIPDAVDGDATQAEAARVRAATVQAAAVQAAAVRAG